MTAQELINELSKLDPSTEVYRNNYDGYSGQIMEIFRLEWMDMSIYPVVDGVIKTETVKVPVIN